MTMLVMSLSVQGFAATVQVKSQKNIEEYKLENGLRVILAPNDKENKIYMNMIYLTGALNDPKSKGGLAHLLEHLAFKGTENVKDEEFQRRLDQYTLMNNAMTDYKSTQYISVIRPEKTALNEMIYLEAERMDKLVLKEKFIPSEIAIVKRERELRMDQPYSVLMDQIWKAAYGNQYFGRLPIGDLEDLQSIKIKEVQDFYKTWYAPNNAVLVISGKFDKKAALEQINKNFESIAAKKIPATIKVPPLDLSKISKREFEVTKGSNFAKYHIYLTPGNPEVESSLAYMSSLYAMQSSGHLYKDMVETGIANSIQSTTWLTPDFNLSFLGADYSPNHDALKVADSLRKGIEEKKKVFNETELNRVKTLVRYDDEMMMKDSSSVGSMLSEYVVQNNGDWTQYWVDIQNILKITPEELNQKFTTYFIPQNRILGHIKPTPEDQKKAQEYTAETSTSKTLDQSDVKPEPLKDVSVYQAEIKEYLAQSKPLIKKNEKKIERGQLKNGLKYALFPTTTKDDKVYASISMDFGTVSSLKNKSELLGLTSYLLLRASEQYSLQDIIDKSINTGGSASASASDNGVNIQISAKKEYFEDYFKYMLDVIKNPKFEQTQFDLIKSQSLSALNRPYTEPDTVAGLTMARHLEIYEPGDLRYHFEPELSKSQLEAAKLEQVKALYLDFFGTQHAQISVTGEFDSKAIRKVIENQLGQWNSKQPYERIRSKFRVYNATKIHALAEQREFGSYQAIMLLPVGMKNKDSAALIVLSDILGDSQLSSRLARELREKNALVYGFSSDLSLNKEDEIGALTIGANYTAGKSAEVSQTVHSVLSDLLKNGVTEQEVASIKANILKKRVTSLEDERRIHGMLNGQLYENKTLNHRIDRDLQFANVTKADVDAVIKKYIKLNELVEVMADQYGKTVLKP